MARLEVAALPFLAAVLLIGGCLPRPAAAVHLSALPKALDVVASPKPGQGKHLLLVARTRVVHLH